MFKPKFRDTLYESQMSKLLFCLQSKWMLNLYLTCLLFKKKNLLLKTITMILCHKKANRKGIQFFTGSKAQKKWIQFSCKVTTLTTHEFHFFCMVEQVTQHSIQLFANWKKAIILFVFMKNEFIIWGRAQRARTSAKRLPPI